MCKKTTDYIVVNRQLGLNALPEAPPFTDVQEATQAASTCAEKFVDVPFGVYQLVGVARATKAVTYKGV